MAVRSRYKLKLVHGAIYVNRLHVKSIIDHDAGEVRVSDQVPVLERLDLAAALMRQAARECGLGEPFIRVHRPAACAARSARSRRPHRT
jgi:hypothetical protein